MLSLLKWESSDFLDAIIENFHMNKMNFISELGFTKALDDTLSFGLKSNQIEW